MYNYNHTNSYGTFSRSETILAAQQAQDKIKAIRDSRDSRLEASVVETRDAARAKWAPRLPKFLLDLLLPPILDPKAYCSLYHDVQYPCWWYTSEYTELFEIINLCGRANGSTVNLSSDHAAIIFKNYQG